MRQPRAMLFSVIVLTLSISTPLLAGPPGSASDQSIVASMQRPAEGYARPPFHVKQHATTGPVGMTPQQARHFYGFDLITNNGQGQVIAIIDAYDDPNIESDLGVFNNTFGLTACTTANGCFQKIYASGRKPKTDAGWSLEMALDVQWAHAIAPQAKIMLVEAASSSFSDLIKAIDTSVRKGATVVSMSFGGSEFSSQTLYDSHFNVTGVTFTASSGDSGNGVEYPAASPYVVAVGGTSTSTDSNGTYLGEVAWSGSGGGQSKYETEPAYQLSFGVPNNPGVRGVPDVAYNGDPNTGFAIYDSVQYQGQSGWFQVGGTSAGAPQWAGLFAIANSLRVASGKSALQNANSLLYNTATTGYSYNYHDIVNGSNGTCGFLCNAATSYDYVTGIGSPIANDVLTTLVSTY